MTVQHRFLPTTSTDRAELLKACGVNSVEELLKGIPDNVRFKGELPSGPAQSELEIRRRIRTLMKDGRYAKNALSFIGAGIYDHMCPAAVNQLTLRGEFLTSYTPYQPEMSQGTLQALFEFQTMVAELFGMEVSNASHYDGSTSLAEAALMAMRINKNKNRLLVSSSVHPEYIQVLRTYLANLGVELAFVPLEGGVTSLNALKSLLSDDVMGVIVQSPNFYGCVEDLEPLAAAAKAKDALFIVSTPETLSLAVLPSPGDCGADIATGEGQSFGVPQSFGGPFVGLFTSKMEYVRQMPGRLCGETVDAQGRRSYTLTLSTREQHIRRDKATSNICTNQNLIALWATIWLTMMGKEGFHELAVQNLSKAEYAKDILLKTGKAKLRYPTQSTFNEFVLELRGSASDFAQKAAAQGVAPGVALSRFDANDTTGLLVCVTEKKSRDDIDHLAQLLRDLA
jgi:glycine dehydrogenase subunit 1